MLTFSCVTWSVFQEDVYCREFLPTRGSIFARRIHGITALVGRIDRNGVSSRGAAAAPQSRAPPVFDIIGARRVPSFACTLLPEP